MSKEKIVKKSFGKILLRTAVILLSLTVFAAGSISYAKYISVNSTDDSANIAGMGIEIFELNEHGKRVENIDYTKVVPGADIPGPHIKLKINSEVNYSLFVKITRSTSMPTHSYTYIDENGEEVPVIEDTVYYFLSPYNWDQYGKPYIDGDKTVETYQYIVSSENGKKDYAFKAATQYNYTNEDDGKIKANGEIEILGNDVIYVSQYYDYKNSPKFTLSFEVYIRQVQVQ